MSHWHARKLGGMKINDMKIVMLANENTVQDVQNNLF